MGTGGPFNTEIVLRCKSCAATALVMIVSVSPWQLPRIERATILALVSNGDGVEEAAVGVGMTMGMWPGWCGAAIWINCGGGPIEGWATIGVPAGVMMKFPAVV